MGLPMGFFPLVAHSQPLGIPDTWFIPPDVWLFFQDRFWMGPKVTPHPPPVVATPDPQEPSRIL